MHIAVQDFIGSLDAEIRDADPSAWCTIRRKAKPVRGGRISCYATQSATANNLDSPY